MSKPTTRRGNQRIAFTITIAFCSGVRLRVLQLGAIEPADRGQDDVVEVALAVAVALHLLSNSLELDSQAVYVVGRTGSTATARC